MIADRARKYVRLSNEHDLAAIGGMFAEEATYASGRVGEFTGREAILSMMGEFFARYPDVRWEVEEYRLDGPASVAFDYEIRGTEAETGEPLSSEGTESIEFDPDGRILHIEVG